MRTGLGWLLGENQSMKYVRFTKVWRGRLNFWHGFQLCGCVSDVCLYWDPLEANSTGSLCQCSSRSSPSPAGTGNSGAITSVVLLSQALCEMPCRGPSLLHWDPVSLGLWALHVTELKGIAVFYKRATWYWLVTQKKSELKLSEPEELYNSSLVPFSLSLVWSTMSLQWPLLIIVWVVPWGIKELRIRETEETLLLFVFMKVLFIFRWAGKGMKKNIKIQSYHWFPKSQIKCACFLQALSGSGVGNGAQFCAQINRMPRYICKY